MIRQRIGNMLARACLAYVDRKRLEPRVIGRASAVRTYLLRYYPFGRRTKLGEISQIKKPRKLNVFLHNFQDSDRDKELHSHPHEWMIAFVMSTGYREERAHDPLHVQKHGLKPIIKTTTFLPLSINFIESVDFHRVDLLGEDAWTLCLVGPEIPIEPGHKAAWGFWSRESGEYRESDE